MKIEHFATVQFYDTDCGGVVSNIAYLRFVEEARTILFAKLGLSLDDINKTQIFPVVTRTEIDYRAPAKLGDKIRISAFLETVGKVRAICGFTLETTREEGKNITLSVAKQTAALVQMPSGKPRRVPAEWSEMTTSC